MILCAGLDPGPSSIRPPRRTLVSKNAADGPTTATIAFLGDKIGEIAERELRAADSWTGNEALADADELRPWNPPQKPDGGVIHDHLELGARLEAGLGPDQGRNHHAACLVNGSLHTIKIP
jgi:hypothetical protein